MKNEEGAPRKPREDLGFFREIGEQERLDHQRWETEKNPSVCMTSASLLLVFCKEGFLRLMLGRKKKENAFFPSFHF